MSAVHARSVRQARHAALALVGTLLVAPAAAQAAAPARTCDELRGTTVLETAELRIVKRRVHERPRHSPPGVFKREFVGRRFYGCALPDGRVRSFGATGRSYVFGRDTAGQRPRRVRPYGEQSTRFSRPAGTYVLVRTVEGIYDTVVETFGSVLDARTGRTSAYWGESTLGPSPGLAENPPRSVRLSAQGILAGVFDHRATNGDPERQVLAFDRAGRSRVLDAVPATRAADIPPASLSLDGTRVAWTNAGQPKTAEVSP